MTKDNSNCQAKYSQAEKEELLAEYDAAMNLTPEQKAFAQELTDFYKDQFKKAKEAGIIRSAIETFRPHHPQAWTMNRAKSQIASEKRKDDYGTLSMAPSDEGQRVLSSMTEEEKINFNDLLGHLQTWHESRTGAHPLHFHPEARSVLWGTALAKLADNLQDIGRKERALFFTVAAWKLSMYPVFAYNAALLTSAAGDKIQARSWFQIYIAEYQNALRNPVLKIVNEDDPDLTARRLAALAKSAREKLAAMQFK